MRLFLLTLALMLMASALTSPLWVCKDIAPPDPIPLRPRVTGRIKGDFSDKPWAGTTIHLGGLKSPVTADGTFSFTVSPGLYILKVCCSDRFERIHREILVEDRDLYFEVEAKPLRQISGRVITPTGKPLKYTLQVSAWLVGTNTVDRTVVSSDGAFVFRLSEGEWRVDIDNLRSAHSLQSMSFDGVRLRERMLKLPTAHGPPLPLQITLK